MRNSVTILFLMICGVFLHSCNSSDEPPFKADSPFLNPQDSAIVMEIYSSLRLFEERDVNKIWVKQHPDMWRGVSYEYDPQTGMRYVSGLSIILPTIGDSIPSSIGGLTRLKSFSMSGQCNSQSEFLVPKEIFDCPLETLRLELREKLFGEEIHTKLPTEIYRVKDTLKSLSIIRCGLVELPESMGELENLEECDFAANHISGKVPEYFGDFKCSAILVNNRFNEFNWDMFMQGKTIPDCRVNYITNEIPDEILENYYELFKKNFFAELYYSADNDQRWISEYTLKWRQDRGLEL